MARLLMLSNDFPPVLGGVATYGDAMARAATAAGHEVIVVAPELPGEACHDAERPFQVVRFPFKRNRHIAYHTWIALRSVRRFRPDVLHAPDIGYIPTLFAVRKYVPGQVLATIHGSELLRARRPQWFGRALFRTVLRWPDKIAVNSEFTRRLVMERHPEIDPQRVVTTYLGVDSFWFEQEIVETDVRARWNLGSDDKIVLTVARLDPRKGHRSVLRALALLPAEISRSIVYFIVGDGDNAAYKEELEAMALRSPVRVVFTGSLARCTIRALYGATTVFCMPGEPNPRCVEGFGLAYLEAAAQGVPSIASAVGGAPEVVVHGETGIVTPPLDDQAVAAAIASCVADSEFRDRIGRAALIRARRFTWKQCALQTYGPILSAATAPIEYVARPYDASPESGVTPLRLESAP